MKEKLYEILQKKQFTDIDVLPRGSASDIFLDGCLIIEGGAFRGLYNQGVLDCMMEHDVNLRTVIGVSAGALAGLNYVSGQIGRSARINIGYRHDPRYIGIKALEESHSIINLDFLLQTANTIEPLDEQRFFNPAQRFIAVATNLADGKTEFFERGVCGDIFSAIKASASMPYISQPVEVDGKLCLDGGCSCAIPYRWALDAGFEKIIVIRTRDRAFRTEGKTSSALAERFYHKNPEFAAVLSRCDAEYNRACDELDELERKGRIFVIAPETPVTVDRVEPDTQKLFDLYRQGYLQARAGMNKIIEYLVH